MKIVNIVIPVFNEENAILDNLNIIIEKTRRDDYKINYILVDDGSKDNTCQVLHPIVSSHENIHLISFTRNFGKESAIVAGMEYLESDATIIMDSDLQHPPELIHRMLDHWNKGVKVVEAVKVDRGAESALQKISAQAFYWMFEKLAKIDIKGHSDFKLLDKTVVSLILQLPEKRRFFRGLVTWLGFESVHLPFSVPDRELGNSGWNKLKLFKYAISNISIFSSLPLQLISWLGVVSCMFSFAIVIYSLVQKLIGVSEAGFPTTYFMILFTSGAIMLGLGVIGYYLSCVYDEIKARPYYICRDRVKPNNEQ
ncbi:glycosyltransferase family 2 protein [Vibrio cholerae]|uniref:glycosyltransferase family 2 protein n=1 Tax=Vibrio cholerae TaxID=666 RepID=UPI0011D4EB23|nr:glycosyltransferase family 2 protein [Vibrio cholerae]EGR0581291.1 glycosyltransferase family 2 protein [Vibrio cholerae]TXY76637.1 glycosyltransferase family 2 protein [Vibrio cholerae]BCN21220.1 putative glycosyltransferase [Vibrio cholerae]BCN21883.1 putative glycosyltransferase [Vibrio cholerae]GHX91989.1 glycosyltransferase [Vibrio cholerae]